MSKEYTVYGVYKNNGQIYTGRITASSPQGAVDIIMKRAELIGRDPVRPLLVFTGGVRELWREGDK
jgi:hypothetical protein